MYKGTEETKQRLQDYISHVDIRQAALDTIAEINTELSKLSYCSQKCICNGKTFGNWFEKLMAEREYLNKHSEFRFRNGDETSETDFVCIDDPYYNIECKTSTGKYPVGAKTNRGIPDEANSKYKDDEYHFYMFINYDFVDYGELKQVVPTHIYIGLLKCTD